MKKIYFTNDDINNMDKVNSSFDEQYIKFLTTVDGSKYIINIFKDNDINVIYNKICKLKKINSFNFSNRIILPDMIVNINKIPYGFAVKLDKKTDPLSEYAFKRKKIKIDVLEKAKDIITELHENNIIHCDICSDNFSVDENNNVYLNDIINCEFSNFKNYKENMLYKEYIRKFGKIDKNFDVYLFNIMTYCLMYKYPISAATQNIRKDLISIFEPKKIYEMYKNLLLVNKKEYNDGYIVDEYQKKYKL